MTSDMPVIVEVRYWHDCGVLRIGPRLQRSAWGMADAIPQMLNLSDEPGTVAEAWWGAYEGASSPLVDAVPPATLADAVAADPARMVGGETMPFLLKILAIEKQLSIQVHPTQAQAQEGFADEEARGVDRGAFARTFRDDRHKPEMVVALTPMRLLVGFRPPEDLVADLTVLGADELVPLVGNSFVGYVTSVLSGPAHPAALAALARIPDSSTPMGAAGRAARAFPGDPGALVSLAMNCIELAPGEACFVPPRMIHAYQSGVGVEIMANSDNVVRGGLTAKSVDVDHLEAILDGTPGLPVPPTVTRDGAVTTYAAPVPEFSLTLVDGGSTVAEDGPRIVLALAPTVVRDHLSRVSLAAGQAVFVPAADAPVTVESTGLAVVAMEGRSAR